MKKENTKCRIPGCNNPVWPNKKIGLCNKHYHRFKRNRMAEDGSLIPYIKQKFCERCGKLFLVDKKANHVRWCVKCRSVEYAIIQRENNHGIYRRGKQKLLEEKQKDYQRKLKQKYIIKVLNNFIKFCEGKKKHDKMLTMRLNGSTYHEIAKTFNCTKQNVQIICKRFGVNKPKKVKNVN